LIALLWDFLHFEGAIARRSTYFTLQDTIPLPMEVPAEVEEDPQEEDEDEEVEEPQLPPQRQTTSSGRIVCGPPRFNL
jgi:hypothetical protein